MERQNFEGLLTKEGLAASDPEKPQCRECPVKPWPKSIEQLLILVVFFELQMIELAQAIIGDQRGIRSMFFNFFVPLGGKNG